MSFFADKGEGTKWDLDYGKLIIIGLCIYIAIAVSGCHPLLVQWLLFGVRVAILNYQEIQMIIPCSVCRTYKECEKHKRCLKE